MEMLKCPDIWLRWLTLTRWVTGVHALCENLVDLMVACYGAGLGSCISPMRLITGTACCTPPRLSHAYLSKQQLQLLSLARGPTEPDMPKALDVCGEAIGNGRKVTTEGLDGGGSA